MSKDNDQGNHQTFRWNINSGVILAIAVQTIAAIFWAASLQSQVYESRDDIAKLESRVDSIDGDIRDILVGIEAIKGKLGIESKSN
ncbi:hypothetical protein [Tsuneonella sp. HG222]